MSLKVAAKTCFTTALMEKVALGSLTWQDGQTFYDRLRLASNNAYTEEAEKKWRETRVLNLPQPRLRKDKEMFKIFEASESVKRLGSRFDKRVLKRAKVFGTLEAGDFPSVPFGFRASE